jgi:hypothetical protein
MCVFVVGIIFFPPRQEQHLDGRGDKGAIVPLTKMTHAWRIFPLPVKVNNYNTNRKIVGSRSRRAPYSPIFCVEMVRYINIVPGLSSKQAATST